MTQCISDGLWMSYKLLFWNGNINYKTVVFQKGRQGSCVMGNTSKCDIKALNVSLMYTSTEPGFKACMPAHTNACVIYVSGKKDKSFIFVCSCVIRDPLNESSWNTSAMSCYSIMHTLILLSKGLF